MKLIPLNDGAFAKIDDEDYLVCSQMPWCSMKSKKNRELYCQTRRQENGKTRYQLMGRFLMGLNPGDKRVVRYIDHDPLNNQRANIVVTDRKHATSNRRPALTRNGRKRSSRFKNVSYQGGALPWKVGRKQSYWRSEKNAALASDMYYLLRKDIKDAFMNFPNVGKGRRFYALDRERRMHAAWIFLSRHQHPNVYRLCSNPKWWEARINGNYIGISRSREEGLRRYYNERNRMYANLVKKGQNGDAQRVNRNGTVSTKPSWT